MQLKKWALILALLFVIVGCGGEEAVAPLAPPTQPLETGAADLAAERPTPTLIPALPATLPTVGAVAVATVAEVAPTVGVDSAEPTLAPIALDELIGPTFAPGVNPLTGETMADPSVLLRRPVAIKISNYPPVVRPQSGMNNADLVFEHYAEGGLTRFTAIFYGQDAEPVGSVRSGRLIDLEIPKMYDAAFAYSGASGPVRLKFRDSAFFDRIISPDFGHDGFYRVPDANKAFEHTLFTDTYFLRNLLKVRGLDVPPVYTNGMVFSAETPIYGTSASTIEIPYSGVNSYWQYNAGVGRYFRWADGAEHRDTNTGTQLNFKNVIVVYVNHVNTLIIEDHNNSPSIEIQLWGEGDVSIFRDGQQFDGRWSRSDGNQMITFTDKDGNPLPLAIGNSFIQLAPLDLSAIVGQ